MGKVLIIDDELETLEIHRAYLEEDHQVYTYQSPAEALAAASSIKPDVILLDIEMPFMDGFRVLDWMRDHKEFVEIPVIGITGQQSKTNALKFVGKGGVGYLMKPVDRRLLLERIDAVVEEQERKRGKKRILLVDDELESLAFYKSGLETKYNVTALNSGKLAVEYLQRFVPDMIVLDYRMPLYNGGTVLQMIRKMPRIADVPVIFLTGSTENEVLVECVTMKPQGVVRKSEGREALLNKVDEVFKCK